jgi:cytochrome c biogenesis protein CcmG/thiol:disulfide interchange protein DsbE
MPRLIVVVYLFFLGVMGTVSVAHAKEAPRSAPAGKPWLGISIEQGKDGVLVKGVIPNTPAESAGFQVGDEILKIDGKAVKDPKDLISVVQSSGIGQSVKVELLRNKKIITKTLKLVVRPDELKLLRDRLMGKPAPNFDLEVIHGSEPGSLKKLTGRVAIVEIWATWCSACRATHPRLSEVAAANPNLAVVAISDEDKDTLKSYSNRSSPKFTILRDTDGKSLSEWMASAIPMISVIGKDGKIAFVTVGAGEAAEEAIRLAIALSKK